MKSCYFNILCVFLIFPLTVYSKTISPFDYGLRNAVSGVERYEILYKTHAEALKIGADVDYSGIKRVYLDIPKNAKSIPLTDRTDFKDATFLVKNKQKDFYLFELIIDAEAIVVDKKLLGQKKCKIPEMVEECVLIAVSDKTPWVEKRRGYSYGATRKDMIVVKNSKMKNLPIMPYDNTVSVPNCIAYPQNNKRKTFRNIKLIRSDDSNHKTFLLKIKGAYNVLVSNVGITTPNNSLNADAAIMIENSAKIVLRDVTIEGTYSQPQKYGYGISLDNVYDVSFIRLKANANWGIFGNNNVHRVVLDDCDINRFDIHCYGKDVYCKNTTFRNLYNQFSSFYGTLKYEKCRFINFVPVLLESSYSAYTYFKIVIDKCSIDVDVNRPYLVNAGNPSLLQDNPREELTGASWPDIEIRNLTVNSSEEIKNWTLFQTSAKDGVSIDGLSYIKVAGLKFPDKINRPKVKLSNKKLKLKNKVITEVYDSNIQTIE